MKQVLACLLLLFVWSTSASSHSSTPDIQDSEERTTVVEVTGVSHNETGDTVIDMGEAETPSAVAMRYPAFGSIDGISEGGVGWINERGAYIYKDLTEDQQREIITSALRGDFAPGSISVNFWKVVACVSDPIGNLAKVAVVVLPLLASGYYGATNSEHSEEYSSFAASMGIATSVAGVISLTFDKICGYANDKIASQEKVAICLQAMKAAKKDE